MGYDEYNRSVTRAFMYVLVLQNFTLKRERRVAFVDHCHVYVRFACRPFPTQHQSAKNRPFK